MENHEKATGNNENLATEIIRDSEKRWFKAFLIAMALAVFLFVVAAGTNLYWIHMFNSYEYVYQDGEGQNNYNSNVEGDVKNVTND